MKRRLRAVLAHACVAPSPSIAGVARRRRGDQAQTVATAAEAREDGGTVFVEPEVVIEVLFSDLRWSPSHRAGLALRFARILRVRDDEAVADVDTLAHLRALLAAHEAHRGAAS